MIIDADALGLDGVVWAVVAVVTGVTLGAVVVALVAARLGRRRFDAGSVALGALVAIAALVTAVVVRRLVDGEATGWDVLWAVALLGVGAASAHRLTRPRRRQDSASDFARRSR